MDCDAQFISILLTLRIALQGLEIVDRLHRRWKDIYLEGNDVDLLEVEDLIPQNCRRSSTGSGVDAR